MKLMLAFGMLAMLCACAPRHMAATSDPAKRVDDTTVRDGSSVRKAVIIQETTETSGVSAEYKWIKERYPGYASRKQLLMFVDKVPYDVLHIRNADGDEKDVWFDISHYYGKY